MRAAAPCADASQGEGSAFHQSDPAQRRRLRWRARRGLLENDLILSRFLDMHESTLTDIEVAALDQLLALTDNDLLDLVLARDPLPKALDTEPVRVMLHRLGSEFGGGAVFRPDLR